jgi:Trk K+ transport system NAD-binding subunit
MGKDRDCTQSSSRQESAPDNSNGDYNLKDHVVICNWTSKSDAIIRQLHDRSVVEKSPIIVVTDKPESVLSSIDSEYRGLMIIKGDPADNEILLRADIHTARVAVILADIEGNIDPDARSILVQLAIDSINPKVHTIVELVRSSSEMYFRYTHANEIVCLEQLAEKLLSQSALTPGVSNVYLDLLTQSSETNEIYQEKVTDYFIGRTYEEVEVDFMQTIGKENILLGFATMDCKRDKKGECLVDPYGNRIPVQKLVINPQCSKTSKYAKHYKLREGDSLFLLAYQRPDLGKLFANRG